MIFSPNLAHSEIKTRPPHIWLPGFHVDGRRYCLKKRQNWRAVARNPAWQMSAIAATARLNRKVSLLLCARFDHPPRFSGFFQG
jgi:hypothetical protein